MNGIALVLGGSGFIGSYLVNRLLEDQTPVRVLSVESQEKSVAGVEYIQGNILDQDVLQKALAGCEHIYHLAAHLPVAHGNVKSSSKRMWQINVEGTRQVLTVARENKIERMVYVSSTAVYGIPDRNPIDDTTLLKAGEDYGASKIEAEKLCKEFADDGGDVVVVRPCPVIGEGRLGIFQILFEWIRLGYNIPILGRGDNILQFVHVDDCVEAIMAAGRLSPSPGRFEAYNIGAGDSVPLREGLEKIISMTGSKSKVRSLPKTPVVWATMAASKLGLLPLAPFHALMYGESIYVSNEAACRGLGWEPRHGFVQMLETAFHWYCSNRADVVERIGGSPHQRAPKKGLLGLVRWIP